ncbi:hypothetical protein NQ176_g8326 [Zarea fungicola]|uniref:Uncharacterized protein n=1 Tax=Zarea fungicola TaxID=93591 RepID=A0ACC1MUW0_9HYPO|nr:hypothetical protein NQ176_g8326 [Lecanicillium fungicola]
MAQEMAATNGNKRSRADTDTLSPPNGDLELKRRRLEDVAQDPQQSPGNRLGAIASAISGVFGYHRHTSDASQENIPPGQEETKPPQPPAPVPVPAQHPQEEAPAAAPLPKTGNVAPVAPMSVDPPQRITAVVPASRIEIQLPSSRPAIKLKALKGTKWDTGNLKPLPARKAAPSKPPPARKPAVKPPAKPRGRKKAAPALVARGGDGARRLRTF